MRREKELAERRKNEPQLDSSQDQLVRKIFSKFRCRDRGQLQTQFSISELEKGGGDTKYGIIAATVNVAKGDNASEPGSGGSNVTGSAPALNNKVSRPSAANAKARWGRFSSSSMSDSVKSDSYLARPTIRESSAGGKMFPKLQNVTSSSLEASSTQRGIHRQDTIEEGVESTVKVTKTSPTDDFDKSETMVEPNLKKSETPSLTRRLSQFQPSASDFKEMQSTIAEFKSETSSELSHIVSRMDRLEDMIRELVNRLDRRGATLVNAEQQTDAHPPFTRLHSSLASDQESASGTTEGHHMPPLGNIILRKRRNKTRMKGNAPSIPYRAIPQRSRSLLRDPEGGQDAFHSRQPPSSASTSRDPPTITVTSATSASTIEDKDSEESHRIREFL